MKKLSLVIVGLASSVLIGLPLYANAGSNSNMQQSMQPQSEQMMQKAKKVIADTTITGAIKAKYAKSKLLNTFAIGVDTMSGNVKLSGQVDTDMQYEEAVVLASSTDGVNQVDASKLTVKDSKAPLNDIFITAKVKGALIKAKLMGTDVKYWPINIETKNGVVYLSGTVNNNMQKENIEKIVKLIDGVSSVENAIKVK